MDLQTLIIPELQYEVMLTERFFKRLPVEKMDWKPHPRSMSIKELANHLAELPGTIPAIMEKDVLDLRDFKPGNFSNKEDLIKLLRENASRAEAALRKPDEVYETIWKMVHGETTVAEMPKMNMLRMMCLSQLPHHRAQLGVYFRLLDIPVPASYGPSADEK